MFAGTSCRRLATSGRRPRKNNCWRTWIKYRALGIDPNDPDPGRVTLRRLNRVEYHNTIRDLLGYDFKTTEEFPADDTGYGFDNIGDVLSVSPLLLEKYFEGRRNDRQSRRSDGRQNDSRANSVREPWPAVRCRFTKRRTSLSSMKRNTRALTV